MDIALRAGTVDDAEAVERIRVSGWRAAYRGVVPQRVLDTMPLDAAAIAHRRDRLGRPGVTTMLATLGGPAIGYVTCGPDRHGARAGEVYALYVDPAHWSRGAGSLLLDAAVTALAGAGHTEIGLWVLEANQRAQAFYRRAGLADTGERHLFRTGGAELPEARYAIRTAEGTR